MSIYQNVNIGRYKTYKNWHMIRKKKMISHAEPKIEQVEVPARNGVIDMTNAVTDKLKYSNRTISMNFLITDMNFEDIDYHLSYIQSVCNGQYYKISFDDDPGYYWEGRVMLTGHNIGKGYNPDVEVSLTADVFPYKFSELDTYSEYDWDDFDLEYGLVNQIKDMQVRLKGKVELELSSDYFCVEQPVFYLDNTVYSMNIDIYKYVSATERVKVYSGVLRPGKNVLFDCEFEISLYDIEFAIPLNDTARLSIYSRGGSL